MTNYCENLLEIEGPEEDVRAFCECLQVDDGVLNFHALIPVPEVVLGTHEGVGTRLGTDAELGASALSRSVPTNWLLVRAGLARRSLGNPLLGGIQHS